jgi:hypothetical protein
MVEEGGPSERSAHLGLSAWHPGHSGGHSGTVGRVRPCLPTIGHSWSGIPSRDGAFRAYEFLFRREEVDRRLLELPRRHGAHVVAPRNRDQAR